MRHEHFRLRSVPKTAMNNSLFVYLFIYLFIYFYIVIIDEQVVVCQKKKKSINIIFGRNHVVLTHKCTWNVHNVDANIPPWLYVHLQTHKKQKTKQLEN